MKQKWRGKARRTEGGLLPISTTSYKYNVMKNVICLSARGMGSRKFGDQIIGADLGDTFHIASKIHIKFRLNSLNQRNIRYVLDKVKRH